MVSLDTEWLWPKENHSFYDIEDTNFLVNVKWSKDHEKDYSELADVYFQCAYIICREVVDSGHNNVKSDMWFLPSVYMFRQSMELAIKALICRTINSKHEIQEIFHRCKHNLYELFELYKKSEENYLEEFELNWLKDYLCSLEIVDENSDLFRFPFNDDFLSQYRNKFLDIPDMGNNLLQSYLLIKKCLDKGNNSNIIEFDKNRTPEFLQFANHGIGNCYLWDSIASDGFHKQVVGYSEAAEFLFCKCDDISNEQKAYPLLFLHRNLIELGLKRMFYKTIEHGVPKHIFYSKRKSHLLYKELWKNVRPMIEYYVNTRGEDISPINIVEEQLKELSSIDKNGDMFRYPASYSFEYKFNNKDIDLKNVYKYMQAIFNFLDGCDYEFSEIEDYEAEMAQYHDYW
ncbi:hypothetical protein [Clostridium botulinum]|uniref:HEPN domain-containing protein n=1 Tax=Clostridium botulinum (strain Langeland / NCTC 10281 / Type F) TaxID=441772 RepID=A7GBJ1_CLOBL|nr:hypothetical protein [Clostridium botulinum]ABS39522.1 hypothetical protein CLI_0879 [Clostridium botulinum F str. Langeland]ADF98619.1 hypothetical protein CBF_0850 [Clostridium botulinum F str. 230613]KKM40097.1 hypothetical protein VT72_17530 [Clostridium botulinum]MBY6791885.1 hypothetical protein [Clostridium botulinum]MBY6935892.1 hypothetical protein [Clostridium botulinum]